MISVINVINRASQLWRRRRAARRLDIQYSRAETFNLPRFIRLNGRDVTIDVPDEPCQRVAFVELLLDDCYRLRELAKRAKIKTIIDIGANVGLFGLAARAVFPAAKIHAYEPDPALEPMLASQSKSADVDFFLEAVGLDAGFISLKIAPGRSVLTRAEADPGGSIPQVPFSETVERIGGHVDLVKMDCEGAEWAILKDHDSWQKVNFLTMEYHLDEIKSHELIVSVLKQIGFAVCSHRSIDSFGLVLAERTVR